MQSLQLYSTLVSKRSFLLVFDTTIHKFNSKRLDRIERSLPNADTKQNPHSAIQSFLNKNKSFKIEKKYNNRVFLTNLLDGVLFKK